VRAPASILVAGLFLGLVSAAHAGEFRVGAGATVSLGTGSIDFGCSDVGILGTLAAGEVGFRAARDLIIAGSGLLDGEAGVLEVAGDWDNAGTFNAGTSRVKLGDGCGLLSASVYGDNAFADLEITSDSGKLYRFAGGSTQTVSSSLTLLGAPGSRLQIRSTIPGTAAHLLVTGSSSADFVDVRDNDASGGNEIALGLNSVKGPNTPGWSYATLIPALGPPGLLLLALAFVWRGRRALAS
jgi:hypothetical protein